MMVRIQNPQTHASGIEYAQQLWPRCGYPPDQSLGAAMDVKCTEKGPTFWCSPQPHDTRIDASSDGWALPFSGISLVPFR